MTTPSPVQRTPEEWKASLTEEQFQVARCGGTERAFSGAYWNNKATGMYHCICCGAPLFSSTTKFDSGTGWPSFWDGVSSDAITTKQDLTHGMVRTEINCARCDAHCKSGDAAGQRRPVRWGWQCCDDWAAPQ